MRVSKLSLVKTRRLAPPAQDSAQHPQLNHLLRALPEQDFAGLGDHLELVYLRLGDMLYEPGKPLQHAYFPTTAIVSLNYVTAAGTSVETAGVGNEGMVGIPLFMGGNTTPGSAVVHTAGYAYRVERALLKQEFSRAGGLQQLLLRYTQALVTQICQNAACNRHHSVEQQLSRWLLLTMDRIASGQVVMTQELMANMLGVRRESVTAAASNLQAAGCISYRRGHISVLNREALENRACECYAMVKKELQRLMGERQVDRQ
ncbi:MAG TPA: Crp/Fnr family transcriptional regulator [Cellvibrio sp.]|nr:Crp/Fnr family transcriptional regulator [Cellvibrio sp.]